MLPSLMHASNCATSLICPSRILVFAKSYQTRKCTQNERNNRSACSRGYTASGVPKERSLCNIGKSLFVWPIVLAFSPAPTHHYHPRTETLRADYKSCPRVHCSLVS